MKGPLCKLLIIVLSLFLSSCFSLRQGPDRDSLSKTAREYLRANEYHKALETYHRAWNDNPDSPGLGNDYIQVIEHVKKGADRAYAQEDFSSAGYLYHVLLQYFLPAGMRAGSFSFSKDALQLGVKNCSKHLDMRGLEEYRRGNLKAAISTWKSVLVFDAHNAEIKKALQTASTQLKNLEKNF